MNPSPLRTRWQPVRGGLINLFKYEDQVFRYENGHLLLRGDNGSGKSRVLALQLPFLLDGDLSPYRVEPDRDAAKRMEWHLLMDGKYERRTGYTWLEFGRIDEKGKEHFLTLGCGLEAKKGNGSPDRWFFVSRQRIGEGLALVQNNTPLGKRQLASVFEEMPVGSGGELFSSKTRYRKAVDDALFRLGSRYDPLIDLLIQLRQPQLMRDMKEDALSDALSEALPPVEERLINEVAESFQGLDSDRQRTREYREMLESVETFRGDYRRYLAVAVRRLCGVVRVAHSQFEQAARELRQIEEEAVATDAAKGEAEMQRDAVVSRLASLSAEVATLRESPEMRDKAELDGALLLAERTKAESETAARDAKDAMRRFEQEAASRERREGEAANEQAFWLAGFERLREARSSLAMQGEPFFDPAIVDPGIAEEETVRFVETKRKNIGHLHSRNAEVAEKKRNEERCREHVENARESLAEIGEQIRVEEEELASAVEGFGRGVESWESSLVELLKGEFRRGQDWRELLETWLEEREGEFLFHSEAQEGHRKCLAARQGELAAIDLQDASLKRERTEAVEEQSRLREGVQSEPKPSRPRDSRPPDRPGAPFWKRFEFRPEIPESEQAGWEGALESAGFLDAWIYPDGRFEAGEVADVFLGQGTDSELSAGQSLAAILQPVDLAGDESRDMSASLLRKIGNHRGVSRCWVSREGDWANGPHHGRWRKREPEFLGHRAREAARQRRLVELEAMLHDLEGQINELESSRSDLRARLVVLDEELKSAPVIRKAEEAVFSLDRSRDTELRRKRALIEVEENLTKARDALGQSLSRRDADAADFGMSEWVEPVRLEELCESLRKFENLATAFWPTWRRVRDLEAEVLIARHREEEARVGRLDQEERLREKRDLADRARSRAETLRSTVGAAVEEILRRLEASEKAERSAREALKMQEEQIQKCLTRAAVLEERGRTAREKRESEEVTRNRAVERMGDFVTHRLFEELDPAAQPARETFSATAAVELARRFERELKDHPETDEHWNKLQSVIQDRFNEFSDQLGRHGPYPHIDRIDESSVCVVRAEFQSRQCTVGELEGLLSTELENRLRIFEEEERKVIENHLIGEAAVAVRDRIRAGDDWVRDVNDELARVPTSSGIQLKFEWRLADPDDHQLKSVRELFRKHAATWTIAEREEIGGFLQDRIQRSREEDDSRAWRDLLGEALNYRGWHHFGILRKQSGDSDWKRLTRRTFGTGSGGEKALTLTVPQFAAAAAHYHSAHPHAPRLILLDEVFVGIDAKTRARLMSLLEVFDLDYVMTSEREWGAFPTVSGLAIYQLASRPGFNAVAVTRWVWNGREKKRDPGADEERSTTPVESAFSAMDSGVVAESESA